jgi:hypothetical protein
MCHNNRMSHLWPTETVGRSVPDMARSRLHLQRAPAGWIHAKQTQFRPGTRVGPDRLRQTKPISARGSGAILRQRLVARCRSGNKANCPKRGTEAVSQRRTAPRGQRYKQSQSAGGRLCETKPICSHQRRSRRPGQLCKTKPISGRTERGESGKIARAPGWVNYAKQSQSNCVSLKCCRFYKLLKMPDFGKGKCVRRATKVGG